MLKRQQFIMDLMVASLAACCLSCGGAKGSSSTSVAAADKAPLHVDVPASVTREERNQYLPLIFELPADHPQRAELRDVLVKSYATDFDVLEESDTLGRMKLFSAALGVHHSADFAPERVSLFAVPMARWVAEHLARQGNEPAVLAALRFLMLAEPGKVEHKERYFELSEWSAAARSTMATPVERNSSLIDLYREMQMLVPDREIAEKLATLYVQRHRELAMLFSSRNRRNLDLSGFPEEDVLAQLLITPILVIHAMFLVDDPGGARRFLEPLVGDSMDAAYLALLDRIYQRRDIAPAYYELARRLEQVDRRAALKAAFLARREDPSAPLYPLYIGQSFDKLELPECSTDFYAEAARLAPEDEELQAEAFQLSRKAMLSVHFAEKTACARYAVTVGDAMVAKVKPLLAKVDKESSLPLVVAQFLYSMGDVEFDDGLIDQALAHYQGSHEVLPDSRALVRISEVRHLRGENEPALALLDEAASRLRQTKALPGYFEATIEEHRGDVLSVLGRRPEAKTSWIKALDIWRKIDRSSEHASLAAVRRGVLLDRLGEPKASSDEFRQAIRLDPDNRSTYAEILSFLVVRRRLEDAEWFYRLAYNQDRIEPMWKIYYSLWVEGLAMRSTEGGRFELARAYLEQSEGKSWQDNLAAFFVGKLSAQELSAKAGNKGQQVEIDYYGALLDLGAGKTAEAHTKLRRVLDSNLMGFFEYRMARGILVEELATPR